MTISKRVNLFLGFCIIVALIMLAAPSWATDKPTPRIDDCNGIANCNDIDARGGSGGDGGEGGDASAVTGPVTVDGTGGTGGGATVNTKSENTSLVLSGARDTADCFTKIGVGAEGFGLFWSRSDSFCKKVRLISSHIDRGNYAAAVRLECTLPEWEEVYGHKKPRDKQGNETEGYVQCKEDLMPEGAQGDDGSDITGHVLTPAEYEDLLAQAANAEEVEEYVEQSEYRFAQQTNLIAALEADHEDDSAEIDRLKREAAALRAAEQEREDREMVQQTGFQKLYEKQVAQEEERAAQVEEKPHE